MERKIIDYGLGFSLRQMLDNYIRTMRRTGRTEAMIEEICTTGESVIIVFLNHKERDRVKRLLSNRTKVGMELLVIRPSDIDSYFPKLKGNKRVYFDHSWVEEFYKEWIDEADSYLRVNILGSVDDISF